MVSMIIIFAGLEYDAEKELMFCTYCRSSSRDAARITPFASSGCASNRIESIQAHFGSVVHNLARNDAVRQERPEEPGPMDNVLRHLEERNKKVLIELFDHVYYILKYEKPFTDLVGLLQLAKKHNSQLTRLQSYANDQAARRIGRYIALQLRESLIAKVNNAKFISLLYDGATDASVTEVEIIYVRFLDEDIGPRTCYVALTDVDHAHAEGVFHAITNKLDEIGIVDWQDRLVGLGSDGAKVNIGANNSVATRMREGGYGYIVVMHCMAHRLELAVLHSIRDSQLLQDLKDVLNKLHKHYHYSAKALRELKLVAEAMEATALKPTRLSGTRWTPHMSQALKHLCDAYPILVQHFQHTAEARAATAEVVGRARFLEKKLREPKFLHFIFFMRDVLAVLTELSLTLQNDGTTPASMMDALELASLKLVELQNGPGENLTQFQQECHRDAANVIQFRGIELQQAQGNRRGVAAGRAIQDIFDPNHYVQTCAPVARDVFDHVNQIVDAPRDRLVAESTPVLVACRIFEITEWPNDRLGLAQHGNADIQMLSAHFEPVLQRQGCNLEAIPNEWLALKAALRPRPDAPMRAGMSCANYRHDHRFSNIMLIFDITRVLPVSSASCERGFSALKRIKSDWRATLDPSMADLILTVSLEGVPLVDYDAMPALTMWWEGGQRRRRPHFVDAVPAIDDNDELINYLLGHGALDQ